VKSPPGNMLGTCDYFGGVRRRRSLSLLLLVSSASLTFPKCRGLVSVLVRKSVFVHCPSSIRLSTTRSSPSSRLYDNYYVAAGRGGEISPTTLDAAFLSSNCKHYVFGYGSLMCPESRKITNPNLADKATLPVLIQDMERVWAARTSTGYTAMGVQFRPGSFCTGILIGTIDADEVADLDQREASYNRLPLYVRNNRF
jgi:hypothetical protein